MAMLVQKYGGTSVGDLACIESVADKVITTIKAGHQVVVVVSAMTGDTDKLISYAKTLHETPDPREYDVLVSTGEQVSMALLCMALIKRGYRARSYTGHQAGVFTDDLHQQARIMDVNCQRLLEDVTEGIIPVVAGFQGVDARGDVTTLGRGGSDTTGVALAAALKAKECQIYTDVEGVYTADPRIVPEARRLSRITFEEMLELASLGAKVLQNRAVEYAGTYQVPLRVLSTFVDGPGTLITFEDHPMEKTLVSGIAFNRNEAKLTIVGIPDTPGVAYKILGPISEANIVVDMIIQNCTNNGKADLTFTVSRDDYQKALEILDKLAIELGADHISGNNKVGKLSIVGLGMRSHPGVACKMFKSLGDEGINVMFIATSEIKVSVVVDEKYLELGARVLHSAFNLDVEPKEEFDPLK